MEIHHEVKIGGIFCLNCSVISNNNNNGDKVNQGSLLICMVLSVFAATHNKPFRCIQKTDQVDLETGAVVVITMKTSAKTWV